MSQTPGVAPPGPTQGQATLYPAFLKLAGRPVLLVGGGPVATQKFEGLAAAGAIVTIVAPEIQPALRARAAEVPGTQVLQRVFLPADVEGKWFVVAAAPPAVNREVGAVAAAYRLFVNAVDDPEAATAYAGSVMRRGELTLSISTAGRAPALAGLLREALEYLVPAEAADWVTMSEQLRAAWKQQGVALADRRAHLLEALLAVQQRRDDQGEPGRGSAAP